MVENESMWGTYSIGIRRLYRGNERDERRSQKKTREDEIYDSGKKKSSNRSYNSR